MRRPAANENHRPQKFPLIRRAAEKFPPQNSVSLPPFLRRTALPLSRKPLPSVSDHPMAFPF